MDDPITKSYRELGMHEFHGSISPKGEAEMGNYSITDIREFQEVAGKVDALFKHNNRIEQGLRVFLEKCGIKPKKHMALMLGQLCREFTMLLPSVKYNAIKKDADGVIKSISRLDIVKTLNESNKIKADGYWKVDKNDIPYYDYEAKERDDLLI
jgi:hypothetical protein